jgi:hypothetical protein
MSLEDEHALKSAIKEFLVFLNYELELSKIDAKESKVDASFIYHTAVSEELRHLIFVYNSSFKEITGACEKE